MKRILMPMILLRTAMLLIFFGIAFPEVSSAEDTATTALSSSASITGPTYRDPVTGMEFVFVKGGCFQMGDIEGTGRENERPVHEVCVDDYYLGKYEVTQGQWQAVMESNPSSGQRGDDYPVNEVSWTDANTFAIHLKSKTGLEYRLPTEAEWEYAARSGGKSEKWPGTNGEDGLKDYAWFKDRNIHPVGQKKPNDLGLHDMAGNVKEWVSDEYSNRSYEYAVQERSTGQQRRVIRAWSKRNDDRVVRGGCFSNNAHWVRTSHREKKDMDRQHEEIGFRLAMQPSTALSITVSIRFQPPVMPGDGVYIHYSGGRDAFIVTDIQADGMMVTREDSDAPLFIQYPDMSSLKVRVPRTPGQGAAMGLWKGAAIGGAAGLLLSSGNAAMAIVGANWGLFSGAVLGASDPGDRWENIEFVEQVLEAQTGGPGRNGAVPSRNDAADPGKQYEPDGAANGRERTGKGFYLSTFIPVTSLLHDHHGSVDYVYINSLGAGAGLGIRAGYAFDRHVSLEWTLSSTWQSTNKETVKGDDIGSQLFTGSQFDLAYHLPLAGTRFVPYLQGGLGYYWLGDNFNAGNSHYRGRGSQTGLGIKYPLQKDLVFSAGLTSKRIVFKSGSWMGTNDVHLNAVTLDAGFTHYFR